MSLLMPALFPSWRFFAMVAPSPRIETVVLQSPDAWPPEPSGGEPNAGIAWQPYAPKPPRLSFVQRLTRLVWNPAWNEQLYLVTCAERVLETGCAHGEQEILRRVGASLASVPRSGPHLSGAPAWFCVRLVLVQREVGALTRHEAWRSAILPLSRALGAA